ncbi:hypothetical protein AFK69_07520 [Xenorhabdus sp. GDc328]|nr:hypothetical protein AAY47_10115 [Xenorhabdus griffiniae]KOP33798.1 hypothetical protein AFK69_07520 [Xenorhabdus sp. GDc328]
MTEQWGVSFKRFRLLHGREHGIHLLPAIRLRLAGSSLGETTSHPYLILSCMFIGQSRPEHSHSLKMGTKIYNKLILNSNIVY